MKLWELGEKTHGRAWQSMVHQRLRRSRIWGGFSGLSSP